MYGYIMNFRFLRDDHDSVCKSIEDMLIFNTHRKKTKNKGSFSHLHFSSKPNTNKFVYIQILFDSL